MGIEKSKAKLFLVLFNIFVYLICASSIGLAIWVLVDKTLLLQLAKFSVKQNTTLSYLPYPSLIESCAYALLGLGLFNFLVGLFGCCGAIGESKCFLWSYIICTLAIMSGEVTVVGICGYFSRFVNMETKQYLSYTLNNYYVGLPHSLNTTNKNISTISNAWDFAHILFKCCGLNGPEDFWKDGGTKAALWHHNKRSYVLDDIVFRDNQVYIPPTCCQMRDHLDLAHSASLNDFMSFMKNKTCPIGNLASTLLAPIHYNTKGCYESIKSKISQYANTMIVAAVLVILIEMSGIIAAGCLMKSLRNKNDDKGKGYSTVKTTEPVTNTI